MEHEVKAEYQNYLTYEIEPGEQPLPFWEWLEEYETGRERFCPDCLGGENPARSAGRR